MALEEDFESKVKCLHHLIYGHKDGGEVDMPIRRTKRVFETENPPEAARLWNSGEIPRTFHKLGYVLQSPEQTKEEDDLIKTFNTSKMLGSFPRSNSNTAGNQPNENYRDKNGEEHARFSASRNINNNKPLVSAQGEIKTIKSKFNNYIPPRKFSPPKVEPTSGTSPNHHQFNVSKQSLFSTIQQDKSKSSSFSGRTFPNRFQCKNVDDTDMNFEADTKNHIAEKDPANNNNNPFRTAHQQLVINDRAKGIKRTLPAAGTNVHVSGLRKTARLDAPSKAQNIEENAKTEEPISENPEVEEIMQHPSMKNIDPKMVETVLNEVFDVGETDWNDIAGLEGVKNVIKEIIIWPMLRPDIFTGLRGPPKGILLFGPPGTGKTMIGRLIATQSKSAFFNISASSLTSKWIGDGEKMVRALFGVARVKQPAVIFIDEIDSILTQRSDTEHESSRRLKTEFLIQFDGCGTKSEDRILVIGVTNRPQELDEAARRRLVKRIYIPLPDVSGRKQLVKNLLGKQANDLHDEDYDKISELSDGYSGADMATLCQEASYGPIRDVGVDIQNICADQVRPMQLKDFVNAIRHVKASVDQSDLVLYEDWDKKFGCHL